MTNTQKCLLVVVIVLLLIQLIPEMKEYFSAKEEEQIKNTLSNNSKRLTRVEKVANNAIWHINKFNTQLSQKQYAMKQAQKKKALYK